MDRPADDLAAVVPPTRTVRLGGVEHTLGPVTLGQLPGVIAALAPIGAALTATKKLTEGNAEQIGMVLLGVLLDNPQVLINALEAVSGAARADVERADMAEAVELLTALIELNADFFAKAVAPKLEGLLTAVGTAMPKTPQPGLTPASG